MGKYIALIPEILKEIQLIKSYMVIAGIWWIISYLILIIVLMTRRN